MKRAVRPALSCLVALYATACGGQPSPSEQSGPETGAVAKQTAPAEGLKPVGDPKGRVVILGFDGVEPNIVDAMFAAGELPNLAELRDQGTYSRLASSNPPQSPTAWSSFTTSKHPGNHGVYDFLLRAPATYTPGVGFGNPTEPVLADDGSLAKPPQFDNIRKGDSFWKVANEQGSKVKILTVPFAYPAEDLEESCMLCGLGVPDIRGTNSTFFLMSDAISAREALSGGVALPLVFKDGAATVEIEGLRDPKDRKKFISVPITVSADRGARHVTVKHGEQEIALNEGEWSPWLEWTFSVSAKYDVRAISRIHVLEAGDQVRLYMTCLQFHPIDQYIRFTTPVSYGAELKDRYGFFKTIGWEFDTHALRQDALTNDVFLQDVRDTMAWTERLTLDEMDRGRFDLLVAASTGPDRVSHMFWAYRDSKHPLYTPELATKYGRAVEDIYTIVDGIVGNVMAKLAPNDLLLIMSDHGFHSFRRGFNVNTWLIREGYLSVEGQTDAATAANPKSFLDGYDWSKSKAYNLGLGSIFLNLRGREGKGIVDPKDADAVIAEIRAKLLAVTDPKTGEKVFSQIYTRADYQGNASADAPDIQLGYAEGYQSTKDAVKGTAPAELFEDNDDKWSGEHAASDPAITPGIFFSNKPIVAEKPDLVDIGVTTLHYLGRGVPNDFEGKDLF